MASRNPADDASAPAASSEDGAAAREVGGDDAHPSGFDYELPPELIAQDPAAQRDGARLMVVDRAAGTLTHSSILDLPGWLRPDDLLVVNRSRVIPARLRAQRSGGGAAEVLLIAPLDDDEAARGCAATRWKALVRPARRLRAGQRLTLVRSPSRARDLVEQGGDGDDATVEILRIDVGYAEVALPAGVDTLGLLDRMGEPPLPPYIRRPDGATADDWTRYQTVFADEPGSIAAPTAGLHLSERVLEALRARGVEVAEILLHVGPSTFLAGRPGRAALAVEPERYAIPGEARARILDARGKRRVVAVGTTTTRALESAARAGWADGMQTTSLVLAPGVRFLAVDALLTNLHLPGSSLLALVSAFAGTDLLRRAYEAAVAERYRFYSYGDAMLLV